MEIVYTAELSSPIGTLRLASTDKGLAWLGLPRAGGCGLSGWLRRHAPHARIEPSEAVHRSAMEQILEYLGGERVRFELPLDLRATGFQRAVYDELLQIPYGETRFYAEVARRIGRPRAMRATGAANGANPLPLVVPCHRVVASDGLGGYGGGLALKRRLLAMERSRVRVGDLL